MICGYVVFERITLDDLLIRNKQREDIVHVLKLVCIWSSTTYLKFMIFDQRHDANDLVKCFIQLLNENITNENKQLIVEFIWNIMQINRKYLFLGGCFYTDLCLFFI